MAPDSADDLAFTITGPDGDEAVVDLPADLVVALRENEDESSTDVFADVSLVAFVSRAHQLAHHQGAEPSADVQAAEERALELFEERFGVSYAEATGHSH